MTNGAERATFLPGIISAAGSGREIREATGRRCPSFARFEHYALVIIAVLSLTVGLGTRIAGNRLLADLLFTLGTIPVAAGLAVAIVRDFLAGRLGVDAIALLSMTSALALGEPLAGAVIALMYSGGNVLEDLAVARAERDLRSLIDRAPRVAHRCSDGGIVELPVAEVSIGDRLLSPAAPSMPGSRLK